MNSWTRRRPLRPVYAAAAAIRPPNIRDYRTISPPNIRDYRTRTAKNRTTPPTPSHCSTALTTFLCIVLTAGAHYSEESLAPEEPALEALGFGPVTYALLTIAPTALGLVSPFVWGAMWDRHARSVLIMAPLGELTGASLIVLGLWRSSYSPFNGPDLLNASILAAGLLWLSACRAGLTIAEFSTIGRVFAGGSTEIGFASLVSSRSICKRLRRHGASRSSSRRHQTIISSPSSASNSAHCCRTYSPSFRTALAARLPTPAAGGIGSLLPAYANAPCIRLTLPWQQPLSAEDGLSSLRAPLLIKHGTFRRSRRTGYDDAARRGARRPRARQPSARL